MTLYQIEKTICGEQLIFTNQRALYWPKEHSLIISDFHVGKSAHFRKNGIAIPQNIFQQDLERLDFLLTSFKIKELIIVGDFLHSGRNGDFDLFEIWRTKHVDLKIILIKGNHDIFHSEFLKDCNISIIEDSLLRIPFNFIHEPQANTEFCNISGHLHPGVTVQLEKRKSVRLPCFRISDHQIILPAFSAFTGLDTQSCSDFSCIAFTDDFIFEV